MEYNAILSLLNENYSLEFRSLELIREGGNRTYNAYTTDNKYFLKVVNSAFAETIEISVDVNLFLQNRGFSVPKIIFSKSENPMVQTEIEMKTYYIILYEYIEMTEIDIEKDADEVGAIIGKLHNVMKEYSGKLILHDKPFFIERYIEIMKKKEYPKTDKFVRYGNALWNRVEKLPRAYSHGDMYTGNIQRGNDGKLYILDLDTSCIGFPLYDLALVCNRTNYFDYEESGLPNTDRIYRQCLSQYTKYNHLSKDEENSLYDMIALYHFALQATIIEIYGLDCVDNNFFDQQLDWLTRWEKQTSCR